MHLLKISAFYFVLIISLNLSANLLTKDTNSVTNSLYSKFCAGSYDALKNDIKNISINDSNYIASRSYFLLLPEGQDELSHLLQKLDSYEELEQPNRILLAEVLLSSRTSDLKKVRDILNFKSSNPVTESYRNYYDGFLDSNFRLISSGLKKIDTAVTELPFINEYMLLALLNTAIKFQNSKDITKPYLQLIEKIPITNPFRLILLGYYDYILSGKSNFEAYKKNVISAYELCPKDPIIALNYVTVMQNEIKPEILIQIISTFTQKKYYSPSFDFELARLYQKTEQKEKANFYLEKAKESSLYLSEQDRISLNNHEFNTEFQKNKRWIYLDFFINYIFIFATVIILILVVLFRNRKNLSQ